MRMLYCGEMLRWVSFCYESSMHVLEYLGNVWRMRVCLVVRVYWLFAWLVSTGSCFLTSRRSVRSAASDSCLGRSDRCSTSQRVSAPRPHLTGAGRSARPVSSSQRSPAAGAPLFSWGSRSFVGLQRSHLQIPLFVRISYLYFITQLS